MTKVLAVVIMLVVAQLIPSCDQSGSDDASSSAPTIVVGWVEEKRIRQSENPPFLLVINSREWGAPREFWEQVRIGDLVRLTRDGWSIVRRAGS
ncbi:MAG: hypothetical protein QN178_13700 [Armatimonadota bacterium]|nr:hypothetical protein [Armatimonadota bacterium]